MVSHHHLNQSSPVFLKALFWGRCCFFNTLIIYQTTWDRHADYLLMTVWCIKRLHHLKTPRFIKTTWRRWRVGRTSGKLCVTILISVHHFCSEESSLKKVLLFGETLTVEETTNYLGGKLVNTLSWNNHTQHAVSKAQKILGFIKHNLWSCPEKVNVTAYQTLIRLHLECTVRLQPGVLISRRISRPLKDSRDKQQDSSKVFMTRRQEQLQKFLQIWGGQHFMSEGTSTDLQLCTR